MTSKKKEIIKKLYLPSILFLGVLLISNACGIYSFTGVSTTAKNISITEFYNNADLGPANMGQTLTNNLKTYFIQNTSLSVVPSDGEIQLEGEITNFTLTPISPTASNSTGTGGTQTATNQTIASGTRITITVKASFVDTRNDELSFKNKTFSFYKDFDNETQNLSDIQDQYVKDIFDRIINDIFNATVANW